MNLGNYMTRNSRHFRDNIALVDGDKRITYGEFERRTNQLAHGLLDLGLKPGDKIGIQSWNRSEIVEIEFACYKIGLVKIPINARLSVKEVEYIAKDAEPVAIFVGPEHVDGLHENLSNMTSLKHFICMEEGPAGTIAYESLLVKDKTDPPDLDFEEGHLAVITYSSGTTGEPKGITQSVGNKLAQLRKYAMLPGTMLKPTDICLHAAPITHASGQLLLAMMFHGGCNYILKRFDPNTILETVEREKVTLTFMVPTMINVMLDHPDVRKHDLSSLRRIFYGGAPISKTRVEQALDVFGPVLIQGYGMSEMTSLTLLLKPEDHVDALKEEGHMKLTSCGRPYFDTEVKIVDDDGKELPAGEIGEITMRGPDMMVGYFKKEEMTAETIYDGWLHSGDMAKRDEDGFIYIMDRKKDMIITGGWNVFPSEVEEALHSHPAVAEVCVVSEPDEKWGEAIKGVVVLKAGQSVSEEELIEHCGQSIGSYKKPRSIDFETDLPKNPNGKILRRVVKDRYWGDKESRVI